MTFELVGVFHKLPPELYLFDNLHSKFHVFRIDSPRFATLRCWSLKKKNEKNKITACQILTNYSKNISANYSNCYQTWITFQIYFFINLAFSSIFICNIYTQCQYINYNSISSKAFQVYYSSTFNFSRRNADPQLPNNSWLLSLRTLEFRPTKSFN